MRFDWPRRPLHELTINFDTLRKPVKEAERIPGPYPYYGASGIVDHVDGYLFDGEYLLIAEDGENLRTRNTPIAFRAMGKFWVNNHAHILQGNEEASTRFLEYAVLAADIGPYLTGAVMPKLTQANLNSMQVSCPPRAVQEGIVGVLGTIDDRIDLLRQTNSILESIAQALFKSWFVVTVRTSPSRTSMLIDIQFANADFETRHRGIRSERRRATTAAASHRSAGSTPPPPSRAIPNARRHGDRPRRAAADGEH